VLKAIIMGSRDFPIQCVIFEQWLSKQHPLSQSVSVYIIVVSHCWPKHRFRLSSFLKE